MVNDEHRSRLCDVNVNVVKVTERAVLCDRAFIAGEPVWFPLSQVELSGNEDGTKMLTLPEWLARSKGWV